MAAIKTRDGDAGGGSRDPWRAAIRAGIEKAFGDERAMVNDIVDAAQRLALGSTLPGAGDAFDAIRIAVAYLSGDDAAIPLDALARLEGHVGGRDTRPATWPETIRWLRASVDSALARYELDHPSKIVLVQTLSGVQRMTSRDDAVRQLRRRLEGLKDRVPGTKWDGLPLSDGDIRRIMGWHTSEDLRELKIEKPPRRSANGRVADILIQLQIWQPTQRKKKSAKELRKQAVREVNDAVRHKAKGRGKLPPARE